MTQIEYLLILNLLNMEPKIDFNEKIVDAGTFNAVTESYNTMEKNANYNCDCYTCQCDGCDTCDCVCQSNCCDAGPCYGGTA